MTTISGWALRSTVCRSTFMPRAYRLVGGGSRTDTAAPVGDDRGVGATVLIVDDHAGFRRSARLLLEAEGWRVVGVAAGLVALAVELASHQDDALPTGLAVLSSAVGWAFVGVGLFAWWRRPDNRVGAIMTATGFAWFFHSLVAANTAPVFTAGL